MERISLDELPITERSGAEFVHEEHHDDTKKLTKFDFDTIPIHRPTIETWRLTLILACLGIGLFLALMDTAIVSTALYTISKEFGNFRYSSWVVLAYTLADVGSAIMIARLADSLGRKEVVVCAFAIFATFSLACGWSKSMTQLIIFRGLQGLGGAGLYSMCMVLCPELCPTRMIPLISTILGVIVAVAGISGPVLGGIITSEANWRWIFWLNGPAAFIPMIVVLLVWPKGFHSFNAASPRLNRLDWLGGLLMLSGSVLLVFMLFQGAARRFTWNSAASIITFVIAGSSWVGLILWEWALSRHRKLEMVVPHFPFRLMIDRVMVSGFISTFLTGFVLLLAVVNVPLRAQIVDGATPLKSGLQLLPIVGGAALGSAIGGAPMPWKKKSFFTLNLASVLMLLGCGLMSTLPESGATTKAQYGYGFLMGLGIGISISTMVLVTSLKVLFIDHAVAQGIIAQLRIFGGSVGVAVSMLLLNNDIATSLTSILTPTQLIAFYQSPIAILTFTPEEQLAVRETFITTFNKDMRMCMYVSVVCLVATLCSWQSNPKGMKERMEELEAAYVRAETQGASAFK